MLFFKRILKEPAAEAGHAVVRKERRSDRRLAIGPQFPLEAVLSFDRRGGSVAPMSVRGWDWAGRLLDCSEVGARILLGPGALAGRGDFCELQLDLEGFKLEVPCRITNTRVERDGIHFGLKHDLADEATRNAYRQLLEIVALGAALKLQSRTVKPDSSGFLVEEYASDWQSCLKIWREVSDRKVTAFEFLLKDCLVRALRGQPAEYLMDASAATLAKVTEIRRLFGWVLPNLAPIVPDDVRDFLRQHTA
jgi:hypothetical protein